MKALVDPISNTITGVFSEPLAFDISGHYVIDIPSIISGAVPTTDNSPTDLIATKNAAWKTYSIPTGTVIYDELLSNPASNVDSVNSTGISVVVAATSPPNKRVTILPGGTLLTNPISIAAGSHSVFFHYCAFAIFRAALDPSNLTNITPGPSKMLYNYNSAGYVPFLISTFTSSVCQAAGPFTNISVLSPDAAPSSITFPASFRLKFINNSSLPYILSDWILIYL